MRELHEELLRSDLRVCTAYRLVYTVHSTAGACNRFIDDDDFSHLRFVTHSEKYNVRATVTGAHARRSKPVEPWSHHHGHIIQRSTARVCPRCGQVAVVSLAKHLSLSVHALHFCSAWLWQCGRGCGSASRSPVQFFGCAKVRMQKASKFISWSMSLPPSTSCQVYERRRRTACAMWVQMCRCADVLCAYATATLY